MSRIKDPSRDSLTTVNEDGSHYVLHPADARGRFTVWRRVTAAVLVAVYVLLPWIPIRGNPAVFLDIANLRFHLFGFTLAIQDMWLMFFLISGLGFTLYYVTALFGRIWCGWACPQTVFLEHVYRRIERLLEGDAPKRHQLDRAPWTASKWFRRGLKQALFVLVSFVIAHIFIAYFVSLPHVWQMMTHAPTEHWSVFVFISAATAILYVNFAWFREQLCIIICPYGRLQSALIDDDSLVIGYDAGRGEPRGKIHRGESGGDPVPSTGDCIDCHRCVQVCPTGIDIRQGLQMECIGCANCIDACNEIMDKVERPRGLIRYDSSKGLAGGRTRFLRPRTIVYTLLMLVGISVALFSVTRFQPASMTTVRMSGPPYFVSGDTIRNQFLVRVINKQDGPVQFSLRVIPAESAPAGVFSTGWESPIEVGGGGEKVQPLVVSVPGVGYNGKFGFRVESTVTPGDIAIVRDLEFVGPDTKLFRANRENAD
jgi:cytochrome c oxidase accessory protein FixG